MQVHVSSTTVKSYGNKKKKMNLHYSPIVFFEDFWPFPTSHIKEMSWEIYSKNIGTHKFDVSWRSDSPFKERNDRNYIEFF